MLYNTKLSTARTTDKSLSSLKPNSRFRYSKNTKILPTAPLIDSFLYAIQVVVAFEVAFICTAGVCFSVASMLNLALDLPVWLTSYLLYAFGLICPLLAMNRVTKHPWLRKLNTAEARFAFGNLAVLLITLILFSELLNYYIADQQDTRNFGEHIVCVFWKLCRWVYSFENACTAINWSDPESLRIVLKGWIEGWSAISIQVSWVIWLHISYIIAHVGVILTTFYNIAHGLIVKSGVELRNPPIDAHSGVLKSTAEKQSARALYIHRLKYTVYWGVTVYMFYLWISVPPISPCGGYQSVWSGMVEGFTQSLSLLWFFILGAGLLHAGRSFFMRVGEQAIKRNPNYVWLYQAVFDPISLIKMLVLAGYLPSIIIGSQVVSGLAKALLGAMTNFPLILFCFLVIGIGYCLILAVLGSLRNFYDFKTRIALLLLTGLIGVSVSIFFSVETALLHMDETPRFFNSPSPATHLKLIAYSPDEAGKARGWTGWWSGSNTPHSPVSTPRESMQRIHQVHTNAISRH